ncbi:MAG: DUF952 domain-containing protein [Ornithinimicrobium sp.]
MSDRIFHIADASQWTHALAQGSYAQSTRGRTLEQVGFIHASSWEQLAPVAEFVYAGASETVRVLEIDVAMLAATGVQVRYEHGDPDDTSSPLYPHIYGPLPTSAVCRVLRAGFDADGAFVVDRDSSILDLAP